MSKRAFLMGLASCWLLGCGGDDNTALDEHRAVWEMKRPSSYVIRVCGTGFYPHACMVDAVSEQTVVGSSSRFASNEWTEGDPSGRNDPVAGLFERARAIDSCDRKRLSFDAELGFVTEFYFDCDEEGFGEKVSCFVPDTTDLSVCQGD